MVRKAMAHLGLNLDDEYEDYDDYDDADPGAGQQRPYEDEPFDAPRTTAIRALPSEEPTAVVRPMSSRQAVVRPLPVPPQAKVHVVAPVQFADAQQIGDRLKASQPVIVNLQGVERDLSRRMIDFCSGATYALGGAMDKVADQVFLLTPSNVEVSAEEKRKLQERGLYGT